MENALRLIRERRSVRTYDGRTLSAEDRERICRFAEGIENPYGLPVSFKLMGAREHGLSCPVVVGADTYVGGKIARAAHASEAFGYSFEMLVLYAQSIGVGTVWLGGTMNRSAFERGMELRENEMMPCASPLGYPAKKMSLRESVMRKAVKAGDRLPFERLFYDEKFDTPLTSERAGRLVEALEAVRLAPSAVNKQPWRAAVSEAAVHFYIKRSSGFGHGSGLDMQMIDMGIALCHFDLVCRTQGFNTEFSLCDPGLDSGEELEYVASYLISG